jgi:LipL41-expression chaperone Lep
MNAAVRPFFLLVCLALLAIASCSRKPTEEECQESFENFVRLQSIDRPIEVQKMMLDSARSPEARKMAAVCVKNKSRARVLCEIKAKRLPDLSDCTGL